MGATIFGLGINNQGRTVFAGKETNFYSEALLGEPGTSYRYLETIGSTEMPYLEDAEHFNAPYGVGAEGAAVWIADSNAHRAVKINSAGTLLNQVGKAGVPYAIEGTFFEWITSVSVDSSGNIWLEDGTANHVAKVSPSGKLLADFGILNESGSDNEHFNSPRGIAFDSAGNLYISDSANHRIQIYDSSGGYTQTIGVSAVPGFNNGRFASPRHITIYSDTLYIADAGNHRVQIYDVTNVQSPTYLSTIGHTGVTSDTNGYFNWPMGVAVNNDHIFVVEFFNHRVQVFDRLSLNHEMTIGSGSPGIANGEFAWPTDVAVDTSGNFYVDDPTNLRVQQFDTNFAHLRNHGQLGVPYVTDPYHFYGPSGVAMGKDGSLHVTESNGKRLIKLDSEGQALWTVGSGVGIGGSDNNNFRDPQDVAVDSHGQVYVADTFNHRVQVFGPDGTYLTTIGTGQGSSNLQLSQPFGLGIDTNDHLYIADTLNGRVQIFDENHTYLTSLGNRASPPTSTLHLSSPVDVAIAQDGTIYVVDQDLHRVQVFDSNLAYFRTIGESGVAGYDHQHLNWPTAVAIDEQSRVFVADNFGERIQVFNSNGGYLTTLGGSWGSLSGQHREVKGLAVDERSNLIVADGSSHHLRKYALGVPSSMQKNINGFGVRDNSAISAITTYKQHLYTGTSNPVTGGQLFRFGSSGWEELTNDGFGDSSNVAINHLIEFQGFLFVATRNGTSGNSNGGQIWRSDTGDLASWQIMANGGFTSTSNTEILHFAVFSNTLYASTYNYSSGGEIWRSNSGDSGSWSPVMTGGFGDTNNLGAIVLIPYGDRLYAGTLNSVNGAEIWRSESGNPGSWAKVNSNGFGDDQNIRITLKVFDGKLYAGTDHFEDGEDHGSELWTCQICDGSDWIEQPGLKGFGDPQNRAISAFLIANDWLYAVTDNETTGLQLWRSTNGTTWSLVGIPGFGDSNNIGLNGGHSVSVYDGVIYIGTVNFAHGGELWHLLETTYIPLVLNP